MYPDVDMQSMYRWAAGVIRDTPQDANAGREDCCKVLLERALARGVVVVVYRRRHD